MEKSIEDLVINAGDLVLKVVRPKEYINNRKTIIYYHGWSSNIDNYKVFAEIYATYGYQVVLPEIEGHGVRNEYESYDDFLDSIDVIIQSVAEFPDIKNIVLERLNGDPENIVISGHSLGGIIGSILYTRDEDLRHFIMFNSSADFINLMNDEGVSREDIVNRYDDFTYELLEKLNPMNNLDSLNSRSMDIYVGEFDNIINPKSMVEFLESLNNKGLNTSKMNLYEYNAAHGISYNMVRDSLYRLIDLIGINKVEKCNKK